MFSVIPIFPPICMLPFMWGLSGVSYFMDSNLERAFAVILSKFTYIVSAKCNLTESLRMKIHGSSHCKITSLKIPAYTVNLLMPKSHYSGLVNKFIIKIITRACLVL